jgi:hypothetical protein
MKFGRGGKSLTAHPHSPSQQSIILLLLKTTVDRENWQLSVGQPSCTTTEADLNNDLAWTNPTIDQHLIPFPLRK